MSEGIFFANTLGKVQDTVLYDVYCTTVYYIYCILSVSVTDRTQYNDRFKEVRKKLQLYYSVLLRSFQGYYENEKVA